MRNTTLMDYQWLVTAENPYRRQTPGSMPSGWKRHAVPAALSDTFSSVRFTPAACGLYARYGWTDDFLIPEGGEYRCKRCMAALERQRKACAKVTP